MSIPDANEEIPETSNPSNNAAKEEDLLIMDICEDAGPASTGEPFTKNIFIT